MGVETEVTVSVSHCHVTSHLCLSGWQKPLIVIHKFTGGQLGGSGATSSPARLGSSVRASAGDRGLGEGWQLQDGLPHRWLAAGWLSAGETRMPGPPVSPRSQAAFQDREQKQGGLSEPGVGTGTHRLCHNLPANAGHRPAQPRRKGWGRGTSPVSERSCRVPS